MAHALLESQQNISLGDKERLFGYLEGSGKIILPDPFGTPLAISHLPEPKRHFLRIAINAVVGATGAAVDGFSGPFAGSAGFSR